MINLRSRLGESYSPLYFLAALGAGGLTASFFMYLMFLTPHPDTPIPTWNSLLPIILGDGDIVQRVMVVAAMALIAVFALIHLRLLFWNVAEYRRFKQTEAYQKLKTSNGEVQLMAMPLTFAMSINVGFILGGVFVPNLWDFVEYLFPAALAGFAITGFFAIRIFLDFFSRILVNGSFDCTRNNNLSQMLAIFAFSMVAVGFAAPAAMSHNTLTSGIGLIFSILFLTIAVVLAVTKMVLGFRSMLEHGIDRDASVSLWIVIPIITLIGLTIFRLSMALTHNFGVERQPIDDLVLFTVFVSIQLLFAAIGFVVMKQLGYFDNFIHGEGRSPASYALICPGVAAFVMGFFFVHKGIIGAGLIDKYSITHFVLLAPLVWLQIKTIMVMFKLNRKMLKPEQGHTAEPMTA